MLDLLLFLLNCCTAKKSFFLPLVAAAGEERQVCRSTKIEFLSGLSDQVLVYLE